MGQRIRRHLGKVTRYTTAYSSFVARLGEVNTLRRFALERERKDPIGLRREISALCRGSVVLLSSHVEAYVKEAGELAIESLHSRAVSRNSVASKFYYHISKHHLDEIQDTSDPDKIAEKIFDFLRSDLHYWSRTGPFPQSIPTDRFNKGFSNPAFEKTRAYFNRFGYSTYKNDLMRQLQSQFLPTVNMVDQLVDTRNKIAHGELTATKTPSEIKEMTKIIQTYCAATDSVFATWWKDNFCTIRST